MRDAFPLCQESLWSHCTRCKELSRLSLIASHCKLTKFIFNVNYSSEDLMHFSIPYEVLLSKFSFSLTFLKFALYIFLFIFRIFLIFWLEISKTINSVLILYNYVSSVRFVLKFPCSLIRIHWLFFSSVIWPFCFEFSFLKWYRLFYIQFFCFLCSEFLIQLIQFYSFANSTFFAPTFYSFNFFHSNSFVAFSVFFNLHFSTQLTNFNIPSSTFLFIHLLFHFVPNFSCSLNQTHSSFFSPIF